MRKLSIGDIAPGGIAARPVTASAGVVLVQPGTKLTAEILSRLKALGIEEVWLEGPAAVGRPTAEILAEVEQRFSGHEDDELMMQLKAVVVARVNEARV